MFKLETKVYTLIYNNNGVILDVLTSSNTARILHKWYDNVFFDKVSLNSFSVFLLGFFYKRNLVTLFTYNRNTKKIEKTKAFFQSKEVEDLSMVFRYKSRIMARVLKVISDLRYQVSADAFSQDVIYQKKEAEAQIFLKEVKDFDPLSFPFISQYSELEKISPRQAAEEILLKASFSNDILLKTESIRLEYLKKIRNAKTLEDLQKISLDFTADTGKNI